MRRLVFSIVLWAALPAYLACWGLWHSEQLALPSHQAPESALPVLLAGDFEARSPAAAALYNRRPAARIILTNDGVRMGWSREHQRNLYAIERSEIILRKQGVPAAAIVKLPFYRSGTVYDALAVRRYLQANPAKNILLVTSDFHAARAVWIFEKVLAGMPVTVAVAPVASGWHSTLPILLEPLKTVYYRVRFGWLGALPRL